MHSDNKSDVSIVSNEKLPWPLSLDKLSMEFSLSAGHRAFIVNLPNTPLHVFTETEEVALIECQRAPHGTCLGGSPVRCARAYFTSSSKQIPQQNGAHYTTSSSSRFCREENTVWSSFVQMVTGEVAIRMGLF